MLVRLTLHAIGTADARQMASSRIRFGSVGVKGEQKRAEAVAYFRERQIHGVDRLLVAHAALHGPFAFVNAELLRYRVHAASTVFLDRKARIARETDGQRASSLDAVKTLYQYLCVVHHSPLTPARRRAAYRASGGHAAIRASLHQDGSTTTAISALTWPDTLPR